MVSYISKFAKKFFKFTKLLKQALAKIKVGCRWAKKSSLVSGNRQGENFFIIFDCVSEYIFFVSNTKNTHRNKKQKKLKKIEKQKKPTKKRRIKMLLILTISAENLARDDDIV